MAEYVHGSHAMYDIKYHVIWITKYRYKILKENLAKRTRILLTQIYSDRGITIIQGSIGKDHVHMSLSCPTNLAPSKVVQYPKGSSSQILQQELDELKKEHWGGPTFAGKRTFLCNCWKRYKTNHTELNRTAVFR
ncbi:MAG: IS200/IS605 family transposase [Clostridiales bacterium]|nr:IS200/IS605 family transposase [Clostridiales bacterium]